jgi:hypothetical protein
MPMNMVPHKVVDGEVIFFMVKFYQEGILIGLPLINPKKWGISMMLRWEI